MYKLKHLLYVLFAGVLISCGNDAKSPVTLVETPSPITGDDMFYGLTCEGSNDSVIVVYPFSGEDPKTYYIYDARQAGRVIGKPSIGDWVGLVINKEDTTAADMVINLDMLKGTWTYPVKPVMKDFKNMSPRMKRRMEKAALEEMPDSVKDLYLVPREYGFSLKRGHTAQAVGRVYSSTVNDESPVEYPEVKNYKGWYTLNGHLILVSGTIALPGAPKETVKPDVLDTLDFVYLDEDSLVLDDHGLRLSFHRQANAMTANSEAQQKAIKVAAKETERLMRK